MELIIILSVYTIMMTGLNIANFFIRQKIHELFFDVFLDDMLFFLFCISKIGFVFCVDFK